MGEAVMNPLHAAVGSVKDSDRDANMDPSTTLFHRRVEFHLARKPFTGFSDGGNSGFKLETLNPNSSNSGCKSEPHKAFSGSAKASEENNCGLDPELSFRITFRRIGAGLQNLGNTCFLNSVLQCLTYTEPLAAYLQSGRHKTSCRMAGFCALCAIQKHVSRALESTGRILAPKDLVSNLRCISRNFRNARQEDAHEYMVNLLESMHKCCLPSGVQSESPSAYEKSLVHKIFGGRLRSQVKCMQCSFCSNKFDPFLDLSLEIVRADSLYKALAHFTAKEQLDGGERQYQCQQCKQKVKALKQLTVYKAPQVLTIHLKRFGSHTGQKIDRRVEFGPTLDLKPFVTGPSDGDLKYTLYGVLVHAGWSTHSGHYYCFVRTSSGMWYTLDDNQVYQVSERKVLEQKAYILFYVRDRRNTVTKKTVDIQKESMAINALGSKGYNNLNHGFKETIQNESFGKKLNDSLSTAVAQKDSVKAHSLDKTQMQMDGGKQVNSLVASECSSLKKDHPTETSLKVPPKDDLPNGLPISNLRGGDILLHSASSFKERNGSVSLGNSLGTNDSSQRNPTATVAVCHERNAHQNSAAKGESNSVVIQTTCSGNSSSGKDPCNAVDKPAENNVLQKSSGETSDLARNDTRKDGGLSETASVSDLAGQNVHGMGEESVPKEAGLVCKRASDSKLRVVKKRPFKCQVTRLHLSSNIIFGAALGRKKKKNRRRRRDSSGKRDGNSLLSDLGPSTTENSKTLSNDWSGHSPIRVKSCRDEEKKCLKNVTGNGDMAAIDQELRNRVGQDDCVPSNDKQTSITKLSSSGESRCSNYNRKECLQNDLLSMLTRGLEETTVARWDGLELPSSVFVDSQSAQSVSIGYVADEWDEEYDRGKRKKIRNNKLMFGGPNPFQELSIKKAKMKKQKLDHSSSANQPFRI